MTRRERLRFVVVVVATFLLTPVIAPAALVEWRIGPQPVPAPAVSPVRAAYVAYDCADQPGPGLSALVQPSDGTVLIVPSPAGMAEHDDQAAWLTDARAAVYGWCPA